MQVKLDGEDPKAGKVIIAELKPSDACDERGKLRQGDVVETISTPNGPTKGIGQFDFESIEAVRRHIKNLGAEMTLHVARRCNDAAAAAALAAACGATSSLLASHAGSGSGALLPYEQLQVGVVESVGRLLRGALLGRASGTTRSSCSCTPSSQWFNPSSWWFMSHRYALCPCVV